MKALFLITGSLAIIAACAVSIWCAVDMRRNVLLTQAMTRELADQLNQQRSANERAKVVMDSLRERAVQYRELNRWFNVWGMLDSMATLALEYREDAVVLAVFREQFDLTMRKAVEARKADANGPVDHGHDRKPEHAEGDRGGA